MSHAVQIYYSIENDMVRGDWNYSYSLRNGQENVDDVISLHVVDSNNNPFDLVRMSL